MKSISYIDDILDDVLGKYSFYYPREQLREAVEVYFKFLIAETKTDDVYAMKIPYIGHLYKSYKLANNKTYSIPPDTKERDEAKQKLLEFRYNIDESIGMKAHDYQPYTFEYYSKLKDDYTITEPYKTSKQSLEVLTIVEEKQNNKCKTK